MVAAMHGQNLLNADTRAFYCRALAVLSESAIPHLVGGAYALERYTGIERHTKDFDVFVRQRDYDRVMQILAGAGCRTELTFPHWLGKAHCGSDFIDVIFSSGNALASVDDEWFIHAPPARVLGMEVFLCPPEEIIWSKAFVMERERYDGADIAHLIRSCGHFLDWSRLLRRFGPNWRVLLSHLVMFGFIYPDEHAQIPDWVMAQLLQQAAAESSMPPPPIGERICRGTLISRAQYLIDIYHWGYSDPRLSPSGSMTLEQVAHWTAAIEPPHQQ